MTSDRRLIEDFIPIWEISAQAAREKSIRKGIFQRCICVGTTPLSGGTGSGFRFFGGST